MKSGGAGAVAASGFVGGAGKWGDGQAAGRMPPGAEKRKIIDRGTGGQSQVLDVEEYLIGVVACQIPAEYELESVKGPGGYCADPYL